MAKPNYSFEKRKKELAKKKKKEEKLARKQAGNAEEVPAEGLPAEENVSAEVVPPASDS
jgi:hypothetical protein